MIIIVVFSDIYRPQWPLLEILSQRKPTSFDIFWKVARNGSISGLEEIWKFKEIPEISQT